MAIRRHEFLVQLVNTRTKLPLNDDTGKYQVYTAGSPVRASITDAAGATLTQEVVGTSFISRTMTDGQIRFFANLSVTAVDVTILTAGGRSYFLKNLKQSQKRVDVDPEQTEFTLVAAINDKASCTTVRPVGFSLKKGMVIKDVIVKVVAAFAGAAAASNRYSVGRSGNALGFANNVTLSAVGFKTLHPLVSSTGYSLISRYGSDLAQFFSSSTTTLVDFYTKHNYVVLTNSAVNNLVVKRQTAATLTHSFTNTGVSGAGKAYIYYTYSLLPTENTNG